MSRNSTGGNDPVNQPSHYKLFPDMEAIEVIRRTLSYPEFIGFCKGNALKYRLRAGEKGDALQDLAKSNWYRDRLREHMPDVTESDTVDTTPEEDEAFQALHIGTDWR